MPSISYLDSAMGSELISRGEFLPLYTWSAHTNLHNPELVYQIHLENVKAGAQIITANTFRSTPRAYVKTGLSNSDAENKAQDSLLSAMHLARKAANDSILVLGSIAPLEDCYIPELYPGDVIAKNEFSLLGSWMKNAGANGLILETMNSIVETRAALDALCPFNLPIYVSFYLKDAKHLKSGDLINTALTFIKDYPVAAVLMNCAPVDIISKAIDNFVDIWPGDWGIYPNLGIGEPDSVGIIKNTFQNDEFLSLMRKAVTKGATILGGCCGSTPRHITLIKNEFSDF
jgi:homocysteine S-methyltransferase